MKRLSDVLECLANTSCHQEASNLGLNYLCKLAHSMCSQLICINFFSDANLVMVLGEPVPKSERCHNRKGLKQSVNIYRGLSSGIQLTSRLAQESGIPVTFNKTLRNWCISQMAKFNGVLCHETCQGFRYCVLLVSGITALTTINKRIKKEKWTKQAKRALAHRAWLYFFHKNKYVISLGS